MKKIAFIGCGGINSWAIKHLHDILEMFFNDQMIFIKIFDNDIIEEKNILRMTQNFEVENLMDYKAETLGKKYNYDYENIFITEENINKLKEFDDIILGVDNHKTRRLFYKFCLENDKYLLDLRAQGTQTAYHILDKSKDMEYYDEKFFSNKEIMERKGSCQYTHDIENDHIENGNKIIAYIGIYAIYLKELRNEKPIKFDYEDVY